MNFSELRFFCLNLNCHCTVKKSPVPQTSHRCWWFVRVWPQVFSEAEEQRRVPFDEVDRSAQKQDSKRLVSQEYWSMVFAQSTSPHSYRYFHKVYLNFTVQTPSANSFWSCPWSNCKIPRHSWSKAVVKARIKHGTGPLGCFKVVTVSLGRNNLKSRIIQFHRCKYLRQYLDIFFWYLYSLNHYLEDRKLEFMNILFCFFKQICQVSLFVPGLTVGAVRTQYFFLVFSFPGSIELCRYIFYVS